jgi:hypothetical protein
MTLNQARIAHAEIHALQEISPKPHLQTFSWLPRTSTHKKLTIPISNLFLSILISNRYRSLSRLDTFISGFFKFVVFAV